MSAKKECEMLDAYYASAHGESLAGWAYAVENLSQLGEEPIKITIDCASLASPVVLTVYADPYDVLKAIENLA